MLNVIMLRVITLNVGMLKVILLNVVMLNAIMPNVVMPNVVMLSVVAPLFHLSPRVKIWTIRCAEKLLMQIDFMTGKFIFQSNHSFRHKEFKLSNLIFQTFGKVFAKTFLKIKKFYQGPMLWNLLQT
jgi:hypothetical protein